MPSPDDLIRRGDVVDVIRHFPVPRPDGPPTRAAWPDSPEAVRNALRDRPADAVAQAAVKLASAIDAADQRRDRLDHDAKANALWGRVDAALSEYRAAVEAAR